ncbi:MAG TPA: nuclear transport factor 2 family protein, partial [Armatimonadota bacterium]|nr:nuclear transport factor 2 family protein [Armatimonadota bacterium]
MRSAMACTLLCILVVVGAQAQDRDEDQAAVTQLVHQVVVACNAKDATALESLMIEGAVFAMDAFGEAVVLDRDGLISGPQGLAAMPGAVLKEEVNEVDVA